MTKHKEPNPQGTAFDPMRDPVAACQAVERLLPELRRLGGPDAKFGARVLKSLFVDRQPPRRIPSLDRGPGRPRNPDAQELTQKELEIVLHLARNSENGNATAMLRDQTARLFNVSESELRKAWGDFRSVLAVWVREEVLRGRDEDQAVWEVAWMCSLHESVVQKATCSYAHRVREK